MQKDFKNLSNDHLKLEKILQDQVDISLDEFTQTCGAYITQGKKVQAMSWDWDNCQGKSYTFKELSGAGK